MIAPEVKTLLEVLEELKVDRRYCVLEVDGRIIYEDPLEEVALSSQSKVEIMRFVGGG